MDELKEFVSAKVFNSQYTIKNVEHFSWQERYFFQNGNNQQAILTFSYNRQGNFRVPSMIGGDRNLSTAVVEVLKVKTSLNSFDAITDMWRRVEYDKLKNTLSHLGIRFELIIQTNYKDKIRFFSTENELDIELDYSGELT